MRFAQAEAWTPEQYACRVNKNKVESHRISSSSHYSQGCVMQKDQTINLKQGSYQLIDALASGGQGTIWKVLNREDDQHYALKVVNLYDTRFAVPERHSDEYLQTLIKYANAEIAFLNSLDNTQAKHIALCLDNGFIEEEGVELPAFVMHLYHQDDLKKRIKQHQDGVNPVEGDVWRDWFKQLMLALQSIQTSSTEGKLVAHRDLKPANCLFDRDDKLFLTDFGIVRESSKTGLTSVSQVGTFNFCAPEQCFARYEGRDGIPHYYITLKLDIYSAAMVMHEIIVGSTSAQKSLTETSINQHKQTLYGLKKAGEGKIGKLGAVGGLTEQERNNLQQTLNDLLTPATEKHLTMAFHQPSLPNYALVANDTTDLIETMLSPWPDDRPDVDAVLQALANIDVCLSPQLDKLSLSDNQFSVCIGQPLSIQFEIDGKGLPELHHWLQISLDGSPLEKPQIKPLQASHYQLELAVFSELIPQTLSLSAQVNGKLHRAEAHINVTPDADYLWTMNKRLQALQLELRSAWLDQWEAEATTVSKKFLLLEALKQLQINYPEQAEALQQRYDRIDGREEQRKPLPLKKIGIALGILAIGASIIVIPNWQETVDRVSLSSAQDNVTRQDDNNKKPKATSPENQIDEIAKLIDTTTPPKPTLPDINPIKTFEPKMVKIEAGSFKMGCVSGKGCDDNEKPVHKVILNAFELATTEVTFDQWDACVKAKGCSYKPSDQGWGRGQRPVINVSWNDTQQYIQWINKQTSKHYRLPTEAEWEYAARAGTNTQYWWGNQNPSCSKKDKKGASFDGGEKSACYYNPNDEYRGTEEVAGYTANPWGLYDMHGNVWEWVQDKYRDNYKKTLNDGSAWESKGAIRVLRGGSWSSTPWYLRSAYRGRNSRDYRDYDFGFRLARSRVK